VVHAVILNYSGGRDQEEYGLKTAWANSSTYTNTNTQKNQAGDMAQVVEHLPSKGEAQHSNSSAAKKKRLFIIKQEYIDLNMLNYCPGI
jgi:hypothetical protein